MATSKPYTENEIAALKRERAALHGRGDQDDHVGQVEDELKRAGVNKGDLDKLPARRQRTAVPPPPAPGDQGDPAGGGPAQS